MNVVEYALFAFGSLFVIVDPIAAVPAFLVRTARQSIAERLHVVQRGVLLLCLVAVGLVSYLTFAVAGRGAHWISPIAERIITRLMGLLLAAVAVQFVFNALKAGGLLR